MTDWLRTDIGATRADSITIRGRDLAGELMGRVTFTELAFLLVQGRMPAAGETTLLDAVLVSLADHGLTPTVLAARLTYTGAPESLQGAVAAGLLGAGSVFLGVVEDAAVFLGEIVAAAPGGGDDDLRRAADAAVAARRSAGGRIPGLGHPIHKVEDPRTPRMYAIADEAGVLGPNLRALRMVEAAQAQQSGRPLPINGAGAAGAALADLGFDPAIVRGFALLARTAGVVAHLAEEMSQPLGMPLFRELDRRLAGEDA
jgi:citrate synthase